MTNAAADLAIYVVGILAYVIGAVILFFFSMSFFKQKTYSFQLDEDSYSSPGGSLAVIPVEPFDLSSKIKVWVWFLIFYSTVVLCWVFLLLLLQLNFIDPEAVADMTKNVGVWVGVPILYNAIPQLFAALVIVTVSEKVPIIRAAMNYIRDFSHTRASIPQRAVAIFNKIRNNDLTITPSWREGTIARFKESKVSSADFEAKRETLESKWATVCYLFYWIDDRTKNATSLWARNLTRKELSYDTLKRRFEDLLDRPPSLQGKGWWPDSHKGTSELDKDLDDILYRLSQLLIRLIFSSTVTEAVSDQEFRSLGVNIGELSRRRFDILELVGSFFLFSLLGIPIIAALTSLFGAINPSDNVQAGSFVFNAYISFIVVVMAPGLFVLFLSDVLGDRWRRRSVYAQPEPARLLLGFFIGCIWGFVALSVINQIGFLGVEEKFKRVFFGLISGGSGLMAAYCLERIPVLHDWRNFGKRLFGPALLGLIVSACLGFCALLLGLHDRANLFSKATLGVLLLIGVLGALVSAWLSLIVDYSRSFGSKRELLRHEMDRHIVGPIGYQQVMEGSLGSLQRVFNEIESGIPDELKRELAAADLLNRGENGFSITAKGRDELKLVATSAA